MKVEAPGHFGQQQAGLDSHPCDRCSVLLERSAEIILILDEDGFITSVSPSASGVAGYRPEQLLGRRARSFVHPEDQGRLLQEAERQLRGLASHAEVEVRVKFADDQWHWVSESITDLRNDSAVKGFVINLRDVSDQRATREELRMSEQLYRTIVETAEEGIWIMDLAGKIVFANPRIAEILGYDRRADIVGRSLCDVLVGSDAANARQNLADRRAGMSGTYERRIRRRDGTTAWTRVTGSPLRGPDGTVTGSLAVVSDISARRRAEEDLLYAARHDRLTGFLSRSGLAEELPRRIASSSSRVAVLLIDLAGVSDINESFGHDAGDEVLLEFARRVRQHPRRTHLAARVSGAKFALVATDVESAEEADTVAQSFLDAATEPVTTNGLCLPMRASVGIAHVADDTSDPVELFRHADVALQAAQRSGEGWARYEQASDDALRRRLHLIADLRQAIADGTLALHYQPQVNLASGKPHGVEALARWTHPVLGEVAPSEFIPLAIPGGLDRQLTSWVLNSALAQCARWRAADIQLPVAVNVFATVLNGRWLYDAVTDALTRTGVPAAFLTLEITETSLATPSPPLLRLLGDLRELGVRISIDDFGTGYSAMTYLRDLPLDEIKIDRSFIACITDDPRGMAIVRTIVNLADNLSLQIVAEGVETVEAAAALADLGCIGQGFGIQRPAPATEIGSWWSSQGDAAPHEAAVLPTGWTDIAELASAKRGRRADTTREGRSSLVRRHLPASRHRDAADVARVGAVAG